MIIIFFPHRIQEVITYDYNQLYSRLGHLIIDFLLAKDMIPSSALKDPIILILLLHIRFLMKTTNPKVFMVLLHTHFLMKILDLRILLVLLHIHLLMKIIALHSWTNVILLSHFLNLCD